jgi:hypothetical protein
LRWGGFETTSIFLGWGGVVLKPPQIFLGWGGVVWKPPQIFWGGVGWFSRKPKNPEVVPGWGCWGGFKKTKISKINVYFIKKKEENCVSIQGQGTALHPPRVLKSGAI